MYQPINSRFVELAMNYQFITKIWRPDTFFVNGKDSYLHKMTVPNRFGVISWLFVCLETT